MRFHIEELLWYLFVSLLGEIVENLGAVRDPLVVGRAILTETDITWDENFSKEVLATLKCRPRRFIFDL